MATTGINEFIKKSYKELEFDGEWLRSFGKPEKNFKCIVYGNSGNGNVCYGDVDHPVPGQIDHRVS